MLQPSQCAQPTLITGYCARGVLCHGSHDVPPTMQSLRPTPPRTVATVGTANSGTHIAIRTCTPHTTVQRSQQPARQVSLDGTTTQRTDGTTPPDHRQDTRSKAIHAGRHKHWQGIQYKYSPSWQPHCVAPQRTGTTVHNIISQPPPPLHTLPNPLQGA